MRRSVLLRAGTALAALLLAAGVAHAETSAAAKKERSAPMGAFGGGGKEPIKIDADRLDVFDRENKAVFAGNVVAVQGDSTIRCSSMTVRYRRGKEKRDDAKAAPEEGAEAKAGPLSENGIQRVECAGPVTVVQKDQVATGDNAVFDQDAKRIVLTGNVVLSQCQNVTRGSRLVYDMNTGRANMDPGAGGRVSAMFVPQKDDGPKGAKGCPPPASAKPTEAAADKPPPKPRAQVN
ncbi:LptA/OstA family protein [Methylobacterium iners]|uniref:Lipopolysaccharide export system protein LptA n=1 Tax=Methylobacterium iners TaxID=418707 RepID=A0ABQ4RYJ2_9HYPH|nr:LptA/OstA family protein [Methylobacterium iners]GJD95916.1 Lipopolysaccharide export system protein LptA [Methylobacterium iners]